MRFALRLKHYIIALSTIGKAVEQADAIEWAIFQGLFKPSGRMDVDQEAVIHHLKEWTEAHRRYLADMEKVAA